MADTSIPNWMPDNSTPVQDPRKRAIASPFGVFPAPAAPVPGLNIGPQQAGQAPNLMNNIWALLPSGQALKDALSENLGAPVDAASYALMKLGLPIPRAPTDTPYVNPGPTGSRGTWAPAASVPLSSQFFKSAIDNPPLLDAVISAIRRHGLL